MHSVVVCDALGNPFNGQAVFIEMVFGSQANYSCLEGYTLIGNSTRVCQADRQWSGNEPICEGLSNSLYNITFCLIKKKIMQRKLSHPVVDCGSLNNITSAQVTTDNTTFGSQANYSCSEGYLLNGTSTRVCQADGQWSGNEPTCEGSSLTSLLLTALTQGNY